MTTSTITAASQLSESQFSSPLSTPNTSRLTPNPEIPAKSPRRHSNVAATTTSTIPTHTESLPQKALYHLTTIHLFTKSNLPTFVLPNTCFGIFGALSGVLTTSPSTSALHILLRLPLVLAFNYLNVLIFDLSNQRFPNSIAEDRINKPDRPLPSGRITPEQTRHLTLAAIPLLLAWSYLFHVWQETALLLVLTWLYNDLRGGDEIVRDVIISAAFGIYNTASLRLAAGTDHDINPAGRQWILLISAVILTTMQVQDLKDQPGDASRGRRTVPLFLGDSFSRRSIAALVPCWSLLCCCFWGVGWKGCVGPVGVGAWVAWRCLAREGVKEDGRTWRAWCAWTAVVYLLPLIRAVGGQA